MFLFLFFFCCCFLHFLHLHIFFLLHLLNGRFLWQCLLIAINIFHFPLLCWFLYNFLLFLLLFILTATTITIFIIIIIHAIQNPIHLEHFYKDLI
ncbi:ORF1008 [White spot syndrome virus]|uniref:ORF1008 n=1 Tax=White spot syndrome virus TaxID=342409 RepID=A0A2D3I5M0_9VIRU|nr:ORF1008 [White spot syndrome virus]